MNADSPYRKKIDPAFEALHRVLSRTGVLRGLAGRTTSREIARELKKEGFALQTTDVPEDVCNCGHNIDDHVAYCPEPDCTCSPLMFLPVS